MRPSLPRAGVGLQLKLTLLDQQSGFINMLTGSAPAPFSRCMMMGSNGGERKRVLLVEDQQVERERLAAFLVQEGYTVVQVNNGAEAFATFERDRFDLIITDFKLPFLDGSELAALVKRTAPSQPILMISEVWRKPSPANPVDATLHRSCHPARLRQVIAELLATSVEPSNPSVYTSAQLSPGATLELANA